VSILSRLRTPIFFLSISMLLCFIFFATYVLCSPTPPNPGLVAGDTDRTENPLKRKASVETHSRKIPRTMPKVDKNYHIEKMEVPHYDGICEMQVFPRSSGDIAALMCLNIGKSEACYNGEFSGKTFTSKLDEDLLICPRFQDFYPVIEEWLRGKGVEMVSHLQDKRAPFRNFDLYVDPARMDLREKGIKSISSTLYSSLILNTTSRSWEFGFSFDLDEVDDYRVMQQQMRDLQDFEMIDLYDEILLRGFAKYDSVADIDVFQVKTKY
jgi:hypothetical protein